MQGLTTDQQTVRSELKTQRKLLFEEFERNPANTRLAIEIRMMDDRIAELTWHFVPERKPD